VLARILLVIIVLGLLLGVITLTEIATVLETLWDWVVDTVSALVNLLTR
jgi:hypothetical protein